MIQPYPQKSPKSREGNYKFSDKTLIDKCNKIVEKYARTELLDMKRHLKPTHYNSSLPAGHTGHQICKELEPVLFTFPE